MDFGQESLQHFHSKEELKNGTIFYIIKQDIRICMLYIAGQTAGPNWLIFFEGSHGYPGANIGTKIRFFFQTLFLISRALQLVLHIIIKIKSLRLVLILSDFLHPS